MKQVATLVAAISFGLAAHAAGAEVLRWASTGDSLTLDPHAQNEGMTHTLSHQIYEPLLLRDARGQIVPALATDWHVSPSNPEIWVFNLRQGVTFHDGAAFDSADVLFSFKRAQSALSAMKEVLGGVAAVRAPSDYVVEIVTDGPNPILPANLTNLFIMDRGWAEANKAVPVQDVEGGEDSFAATHANGTGPYRLASRQAGIRTDLTVNEEYWGQALFPMDVTEIVHTPMRGATLALALRDSAVDFVQGVSGRGLTPGDLADALEVLTVSQNRVLFFGLNMGAKDLESDDVEGANPLADLRVRQAMNMSINRDVIQQVVMRGRSRPAGMIASSFVNGWTDELDAVPATDVTSAKALMAEAGYGEGFSIRLDCPNDRYPNDQAICEAVAGMMAQIGITVTLDITPKAEHFPKIQDGTTDFYMLGWGVPTFDSQYVFDFLVHSRDDEHGSWNATGYSNQDLDKLIVSLSSEIDPVIRNATIADIWQVVQAKTMYLPVHQQMTIWGVRDGIGIEADPQDTPKFKYVTMQ